MNTPRNDGAPLAGGAASSIGNGSPKSTPIEFDFIPSTARCGVCGEPLRRAAEFRLVSCLECSVCETEAEHVERIAAAGRAWWQDLDAFHRAILSEPVAVRAARRLTRGLLERGIAAEVVESIVRAVNAQRDRPALLPELEDALLAAVADLQRRHGAAA